MVPTVGRGWGTRPRHMGRDLDPSALCQVPWSDSQLPAAGRCVTDHILVFTSEGYGFAEEEGFLSSTTHNSEFSSSGFECLKMYHVFCHD